MSNLSSKSPATPADQVSESTAPISQPSWFQGFLGKGFWIVSSLSLVLLTGILAVVFGHFSYAYMPPRDAILNPGMRSIDQAYDLWGKRISFAEAERLEAIPAGQQMLSPANGAVKITDDLVDLGRRTFYTESFNSEGFITDVLGWLDGGIRLGDYVRALIALRGRGTDNLQVRLSRDITVGGKTFERGTVLNTGMDVARGSFVPLGAKVNYDQGRIRLGVTCAACHATYDPDSQKIVEGATNQNLDAGLIFAMASNTAAYLDHSGVDLAQLLVTGDETMMLPDGSEHRLPDPQALEDAVDAQLLAWPPGSFDTTLDLVSNPIRIPDSFTHDEHPFAWSGNMAAGPFRGLSSLNNNVHTVSADALTDAETIAAGLGLDPEVYRAIVLRDAAYPPLRYDPQEETRLPSEIIREQGHWSTVLGFADAVKLPTFPSPTYLSTLSLVAGTPGHRIWEQPNAMSAFQNRLLAPPPPQIAAATIRSEGKKVFKSAGCVACHAAPSLTNHQVIPIAEIGTAPTRARGLAKLVDSVVPAKTQSSDTVIPPPDNPNILGVSMDQVDMAQLRLGWAADGQGGYKVPGLRGIYWNAPYLHDGGVAVGEDLDNEVGVPATLLAHQPVDPAHSLLGLIDRQLRDRIIRANQAAGLQDLDIQGIGHEYWVDAAAGFSPADQQALIQYLLWPDDLPSDPAPTPDTKSGK
jgi:cytochrome c5